MSLLFKVAGVDAACVGDGAEAVTFAAVEHPDVILLDYHMPGMSGLDVLKRIRALPETSGTPVYFFSADNSPAARAEAERLGVKGWFVKGNVDFDEMVKEIGEAAGKADAVA